MTRATKWLITGLCISVAFNLLIVGYSAARYMYPGAHMRWTMERMVDHLSEDSQQVLRKAMAEQRAPIGEKMRALHESHRGIVALLAEETIDEQALEDAFATQRQRSMDLTAALQGAIVDVARDLPPEERIKLAQGGQRMMRRMMERHNRHNGPPPPPQ